MSHYDRGATERRLIRKDGSIGCGTGGGGAVRVTLDFECELNGFIGGEVYYMA